eukprot:Nitzschia sp. Nitz4//scaffold13_size275219//7722//8792//NITZ4_000833-RA/size275219-processed-gene-0.120-mRNA-1//-1//CDS//3329535891//8470//frame0
MKQFLVVSVPSRDESLQAFLETMQQKAQEHSDVTVQEVTRLVDQDTSQDCFLVSCYIGTDSCDEEEQIDTLTLFGPDSEVWVSGTTELPLAPPYGWKLEDFDCQVGNVNEICRSLQDFGLALLRNQHNPQLFDSKANCAKAIVMLKEHVSVLEDTVRQHHSHIVLGESAFGFQEYTHRGPQRFEVLFDPEGPLYQHLKRFMEPLFIDAVSEFLDSPRDKLRLNIGCVYSRPGAVDQDWHTDGGHYTGNPSQPYAVCVFVPLTPLTEETGCTRFWPKSHLHTNLLGLAKAAEVVQACVDGSSLEPGDFVMYNYTTWHKGLANNSKNIERPVVQFLYSCDWYKERKNYGDKSVFDIPN